MPSNDPSSPTAKPDVSEQEAEKSRSVQRLVRPLEGDLDKPDRHVDTTNVTFQINDKMPMSSVRRGHVEWADQSGASGKIVRVPAVVFGELVMFNKSDVSLLIERNFDDVFGTEVGPLVVEVFHGNDGERPNDPSSPTAESNVQSAATALSAVGCSGLLGDDYGRTLDLIECFSELSPKKGKRLLDRLKSNKISPIEASNEALKLSLRLLFKDDLLGVSES